jgi:hypothetical protein
MPSSSASNAFVSADGGRGFFFGGISPAAMRS